MSEVRLKELTIPSTEQSELKRDELNPQTTPALEFPEGGRDAWLAVAGGFMVLFCTFGSLQSFGVYQDYYTQVSLTDETASDISWIGSVQIAIMFIMSLPSGRLFDAGYFRHLMFSGSLIYLFSVFMLSLAKPHHFYQNFLAQGIGIGLGMGLICLPALSVTAHYFRRRRSYAMGLMFTGAGVGGVIYPVMLNNLFKGSAGFAWGVRAAAFMDLFLLVTASLIMKTRLPSAKTGQNGDGPSHPFKNIAGDVGYWLCVIGAFFVFMGIFTPYFYLQLYAELHGVKPGLSIYAIAILNAASIIGRTVPNFLADVYGPLNIVIPASIISGALIFALFGASSAGGMVAFSIFYGIFSGTFVSVIASAASTFSVSVREVGTRMGVLLFVCSLSILTGTPIAGVLLSPPRYLWWRPIVFSSVVVLFGCALMMVSRSFLAKRKGTSLV